LIFVQVLQNVYPKYGTMPFLRFTMFGFPISLIFIFSIWIYLTISVLRCYKLSIDTKIFKDEYKKLGRIKFEEIVIIIVFIILCILWLTRGNFLFLFLEIPFFDKIGWGFLFKPKYVTVLIFLIYIGRCCIYSIRVYIIYHSFSK
jgi:di/tricarboxylate transporter